MIRSNYRTRINGDLGKLKDDFADSNPIRPYLLHVTAEVVKQIEQQNASMPAMPTIKLS